MGSGRRIRWAERENARLAAEYQMALAAWKQNEQLLEWYHDRARSAQPVSPVEGLKLRRNERVLWTAANVGMVEVPETAGLFSPVHEVYSPTRETGGYAPLTYAPSSVRDTGFVAVTDTRVLFLGARANREWAFAQLDGVAHGSHAPMTVMRVGNRQRLSGLMFPTDKAPMFQFYLSLALAEYRQDRAGFVAHLAGLLARHRARPPLMPAPVLPAQAPSGARLLARFYFGRPGAPLWRKLTPALATVVGLLCLCGALLPAPAGREGTSADRRPPAAGSALTASTDPATQAVTPSPTPSPEPVVPPTTQAASPPPAPTTTKPKPINLCGAPQNPWNYNFCSGGTKIDDPPDDFCSYFDCIDNFWNGRGYVIQCDDNMFSKSGGIQGSCSRHGGNKRPLFR
ncbi:MAG TPA: hypothetical protein VFC19_19145 [Candidatus Limnocylindrales bacterium]|nr:hypothetical protein [Candidatus Limnocylindrales bacterium]